MLSSSDGPLVDAYDLIALDLDGVVYIGHEAVPHAASSLARARRSGSHLAFVTNNAARTPDAVAAHLTALGVEAQASDVVTSAQAAATLLRERFPAGSRIYVIGGEGLEVALREVGLEPVVDAEIGVDAVVQGYGPDMPWRRVVAGAILVRNGHYWVASNTDQTIPTGLGVGPGNGALVELVSTYSGMVPVVAGKPEPPLLHEVERRTGAQRPLFIGDRLDTDMAGATRVGWPSLLVRTGVTTLAALLAAAPEERPSFIAADLRGLHEPQPVPAYRGSDWVLGGWRASVDSVGALVVDGAGTDDDWWRVAACAAWAYRDEAARGAQDTAVDVSGVRPPR
jgi:HAD superfamily hydrolase (TIGR01450 family)